MADTIFALSSGRPPAAVSVIRVSGPQAHQAGLRIARDLPPPRVAAVRELRHPTFGDVLNSALVLQFDGPASATGEDVVELHCHGGRAVVDAVLAALGSIDGLRTARPGEFTRRAFANGQIDLTEAEGLADLLEAETESQRKAALALAEGGLRLQIEQWNARVLDLSAAAERAIDYDEEDETLDAGLLAAAGDLASELQQWLQRPRVEPLKDGVLVVVAGPPNVGKSSLINRIVGEERAIVSDLPGTTRDHIEVAVAIAGIPMRLTDTAGLRDTDDKVEAIGVGRAQRLVEMADLLVWLGDAADAPPHRRVVVVQSKADLQDRAEAAPGAIAVSALTGAGIADLLDRVRDLARDLLPDEGAIALNRRQAEMVDSARASLAAASQAQAVPILAEELRQARMAFDRLTGRASTEDMLDALFSQFCLGK